MKERIEIKKENDAHYRFEVKNEAGQFLFGSVAFSNEKDAKTSLAQLQSANNTYVYERKTDYDGRFHFRLKTADSRILGKSGSYQSQAGMENGIKQMKFHLASINLG